MAKADCDFEPCPFHGRLQTQVDENAKRLGLGDTFIARLDERLKSMEDLATRMRNFMVGMVATTVGAIIVTVVNIVFSLRK